MPLRVNGLHRHRRADHHHHHGARRLALGLFFHASQGADHGHPAVGTQACRVVVAIHQTCFGGIGHDPTRRQIPVLHLFAHATAQRVTGDDAAQCFSGGRQVFPIFIGESVDVLQEHRPVRQQLRIGLVAVVQGPLQAGVANIKGDECHRVKALPRRAG